ncbi:MAG: SHOCT domain-containing protein, partial [Sandaracinaceae bacterium]|nr:SHOCT domain-containing protein [Sandaracinaceae bacterium]
GMVAGIGHEYGVEITKERAMELLTHIGATVGLSLVGSRLAMTAGKILLPGLGGLVAAPFMFASTLALGTVARLYFASDGKISNTQMKAVYDRAIEKAKEAFDPAKARSSEARDMAEKAARDAEGREESSSDAPRARPSVDDLAERLAKLDELYEKGHISDAEHERRRKQILDEV